MQIAYEWMILQATKVIYFCLQKVKFVNDNFSKAPIYIYMEIVSCCISDQFIQPTNRLKLLAVIQKWGVKTEYDITRVGNEGF